MALVRATSVAVAKPAPTPVSKDVKYGAAMTFQQFIALSVYLKKFDTIKEVSATPYFSKLKPESDIDLESIKKWMVNGWNTERILCANTDIINIQENYFALQWSFPQAYYSSFMLTLAFMKANGQNTTSHAGIIKKFGDFSKQGKYPPFISFYQDGTEKNPTYHNIQKFPTKATIALDASCMKSCQTQICRFLSGTRIKKLKEKRNEKEVRKLFKKSCGKKNKDSLNQADWQQISDKIGVTTIMNLLYRKRIKSNYQDIDTYNYEELKADFIHNCLKRVVKELNLIHECYLYKTIGDANYIRIFQEYVKGKEIPFLEKRMEIINNNLYQ